MMGGVLSKQARQPESGWRAGIDSQQSGMSSGYPATAVLSSKVPRRRNKSNKHVPLSSLYTVRKDWLAQHLARSHCQAPTLLVDMQGRRSKRRYGDATELTVQSRGAQGLKPCHSQAADARGTQGESGLPALGSQGQIACRCCKSEKWWPKS